MKLYNLDEDLGEKKNLADAQPAMAKVLQDELAAWEQKVSAGVELRAWDTTQNKNKDIDNIGGKSYER